MFQPLPVEQVERWISQRACDRDIVLVQRSDQPIVEPRHRDLSRVQRIEKMATRLAVLVKLERVAVRFVLHDEPAATVAERIGQDADLLNAIRLVIDRTDDSQSRVQAAENLGQPDFIEEVDEQVGRSRAAVDHQQVACLRGREHRVDLAAILEINEVCFWVKPLQRRVLMVAIDRAVNVAAIVEILHEVRGEEALPDSAFAVDDEVDLFAHWSVRDQRLRGSAMRGPRVRGRSGGVPLGGGAGGVGSSAAA